MISHGAADHPLAEVDACRRVAAGQSGHPVDPDQVIQQIGVVETPARRQAQTSHTDLENGQGMPVRGHGLIFDRHPHAMPGVIRLRSCLTVVVCIGLLVGAAVCAQGRHVMSFVTKIRRDHFATMPPWKGVAPRPTQSRPSTLVHCTPERIRATGMVDEIPGTTRAFLTALPQIALGVQRDLPGPAQHLRAGDGTVVDLFIVPHARIAVRYRERPRTVLTTAIAFDPPRRFCQALQLTGVLPSATSFQIDQQGSVRPTVAAVPFFAHGTLRIKGQSHRVVLLQFQPKPVFTPSLRTVRP